MQIDIKMVLAFIPLVLINWTLIIICLRDWLKRKSFRYLSRIPWLLIFLFIQFAGPACYLILGRDDGNHNMPESE